MPPWQYTAEVADEPCSHDAKVMLMSDHGQAREEPESLLCKLPSGLPCSFMLLSRTFKVSLNWIFPCSLTLPPKDAVGWQYLLSCLFFTFYIVLCSTVRI